MNPNEKLLNIPMLRELAIYLSKLPADYEQFNMMQYDSHYVKPANALFARMNTNCGTVACAAGHLPYLPNAPKPELTETWTEYTLRVLFNRQDWDSAMFDYMFAAAWRNIDNTPHGAAKRIWLVAIGKVNHLNVASVSREHRYDPELYADVQVGVDYESI